jgi:hypothetical protein
MKAYQRGFTLLFLLALLLSACAAQGQAAATRTPRPTHTDRPTRTPLPSATARATSTPSPSPTPDISPTPTPELVPARPQYTLALVVDYQEQTASVQEDITWPNHTGEALTSLVLAVVPNLWEGCFNMEDPVLSHALASWSLDGQRLELNLAEPVLVAQAVKIHISYQLDLPRTAWGAHDLVRNLIFGYTGQQLNLLDWYPFVVPYQPGEGWILHKPGSYGEHLVYDVADFDVTLRFPQLAPPPVVAASGSAQKLIGGWHYTLQNGRTFALSLSPDFQVSTSMAGNVKVSSYYFPEDAAAGERSLEVTKGALEIFSETFAIYPYLSLSAVLGDFEPSMEYDGLFFVGHVFYHEPIDSARNYLTILTAHEVAHQWWFALVGSDQALEPWLDEALATYSERIYYEQVHPEDVEWWQVSRITNHLPLTGWVDTTIYDFNREYVDAVYLRGAEFLGDLRQRIGDEAFFAALREYATRFSHQHATADDFFSIVREYTDQDISDIIATYFSQAH